jgi:hypothetical protein
MTIEQLPERAPAVATLTASRPVAVLDHFRTPYAVDERLGSAETAELRAADRSLLWAADAPGDVVAFRLTTAAGDEIPLFAPLLPDAAARERLARLGGDWAPLRPLTGLDGEQLGAVWGDGAGDVFLPFDPDAVQECFWSERYKTALQGAATRGFKRALTRTYYRLRPLLPRPVQIRLRRAFSRIQARAQFPRWPAEPALHDFYDVVFGILSELSGAPVARIAAWPGGHRWALVLTHDVELANGYDGIEQVLGVERAHGLRSSWNFVPKRYPIDDARLRELTAQGFEVGVHGLFHDGRDLESKAVLEERLPAIREHAGRWDAVGFRSPATQRGWDLMPLLGFDYDASYPDSDPFEPQAGGCCTWLPFFNGELVELPLTMPQDHTLFVILGHRDESAWREKAAFLAERGGMAVLDTHPDYLLDERILTAYDRFLAGAAADASAWKALPRDVSAWWRRRAESRIEPAGDSWQVTGPAAGEASVELVEGSW